MVRGIPVLMYHKVGPNRREGRVEKLRVTPEKFERQMSCLFKHGYRTIRVEELTNFCKGELHLPGKRMVLSFDDGYRDNLTYAFPILKKYGFSAIIFLVSSCVGSVSKWDEGGPEPLLNWEEIKEMCRGGVEFGSHGHTHRLLPSLSAEELKKEIEYSKSILEKKLGKAVEFFSYPWGKFDERVKAMVESCGYRASFSTRPGKNGWGEDLFALRRILIRGYDSRLHFLLNLKLGRSRI